METTTFFGQLGLGLILGLGGMGSALGIGAAGRAAAGAWAKEGKEGKTLNFSYIILLGMPLSQTIYAFVLMLLLANDYYYAESVVTANAGALLGIGLACGLAELFSAWMQGLIGAAAVRCMSESEGKGFAFLIIAMGIAETVGLFAWIFLFLVKPATGG
ncbi:MAG: V-type ATP synthase subunit K [Planctomycetota bacterium]